MHPEVDKTVWNHFKAATEKLQSVWKAVLKQFEQLEKCYIQDVEEYEAARFRRNVYCLRGSNSESDSEEEDDDSSDSSDSEDEDSSSDSENEDSSTDSEDEDSSSDSDPEE